MLCEILRLDYLAALQFAMPLINDISHFNANAINQIEWPEDKTLYRGGGIPRSELDKFIPELKYRSPHFLSASSNKKIGETFCHRATQQRNEAVLYIFHLNDALIPCFNVNKISDDEFLFLPYSVFTVQYVKLSKDVSVGNPHIVHLNVETDSETQSDYLPLIYWH